MGPSNLECVCFHGAVYDRDNDWAIETLPLDPNINCPPGRARPRKAFNIVPFFSYSYYTPSIYAAAMRRFYVYIPKMEPGPVWPLVESGRGGGRWPFVAMRVAVWKCTSVVCTPTECRWGVRGVGRRFVGQRKMIRVGWGVDEEQADRWIHLRSRCLAWHLPGGFITAFFTELKIALGALGYLYPCTVLVLYLIPLKKAQSNLLNWLIWLNIFEYL